MGLQKISIGIVLYKGEKYLQECLSSLLNQSYKNFELLLRDQGPEHEALGYIEKNFPEILADSRVKIFRGDNLWHSGGHNKLIAEMSENSHAYICASNDMWYPENFLENLMGATEKFPEYSVYVPKLKKWDFENTHHQNRKTNFLDSCGISLSKNHHFFDRGQGENDENQYPTGEIFGASGALFFVKKSVIDDVLQVGTFFDESIHYKNDIDLAYRLQWAGNKTLFVAESIAYHDRQVGEKNISQKIFQKIYNSWKNQNKKPTWVKESSFYGQVVVLHKNFWGRGFSFLDSFFVGLHLFQITLFYFFTEPRVLLQYKKFFQNFSHIQKKKREMIIQNSPEKIMSFVSS